MHRKWFNALGRDCVRERENKWPYLSVEALVTLDAAQAGEVHACLALYVGFTRGILSPYSRLCRLVCGYIVNKMQPARWYGRRRWRRRGREKEARGRDYNAASVACGYERKGSVPLHSPSRFLVEPRFWIHFSESIIEIVVATSQPSYRHG